jgi:hypothetical protein
MEETTFQSTHNLEFEVAPYKHPLINDGRNWMLFRVGTCEGLWTSTEEAYEVLAIKNSQKGNGHFTDVLEWFENSCRRDNRDLKFMEVMNESFMKHLVSKQGFEVLGDDVIKHFKQNESNR